MKTFHALLLLLALPFSLAANMANPVTEGTLGALPFVSEYATIQECMITITPRPGCRQAHFRVRYLINVERDGQDIPLLFYAVDYTDEFSVKLDEQVVPTQIVPERYRRLEGTDFAAFAKSFSTSGWDSTQAVAIAYDAGQTYYAPLTDFHYFEADLSAGSHVITVEYLADIWLDRSDWVKEWSFRYALKPAEQWKETVYIDVTLVTNECALAWTTNLGQPSHQARHLQQWMITPEERTDVLLINYRPPVSRLARVLLWFRPRGLATAIGILLAFFHLSVLWARRRTASTRWLRLWIIGGAVLVPALTILVYMLGFSWIDAALGEAASQYHGYYFFAIVYYPLVAFAYGLLSWGLLRFLSLTDFSN